MNSIEWAALVVVAIVVAQAGNLLWRRRAAREYWLIPYLLHKHFLSTMFRSSRAYRGLAPAI